MKRIIFLLTLLTTSAFAADNKGNLSIMPIIGLERVQKFQPTPHMKTRGIFGARVLYGLPISTLEAEYTHAQDTSTDAATSTSYKDVEDKLRLGLRGNFDLGSFLNAHLRGGAQGRKNEQTKVVNNTTTTKSTSSKVQPYIGTGLELKVMQVLSVSADVLMTYTPSDDPNLKDYELQPSLGLILRF